MPTILPGRGDQVYVVVDLPVHNGNGHAEVKQTVVVGEVIEIGPTRQARVNVRGNPYVLTMNIPVGDLQWDTGSNAWLVGEFGG